jgi:hypothetical protein
MKKINESYATATAGQPHGSESFEWMRDGYIDALDALAKALVTNYQTGDFLLMHGCVNTGTYPNYVISAGAIYHNGEIYQVPAASFTATGSNVAVGTITNAFASFDPITFTDNTTVQSVHENNTIVFTAGASGSSDVDLTALTLSRKITNMIYLASTGNISSGAGYTDMSTMTYTTPNDGITRDWVIMFKGQAETTANTNTQIFYRIYNGTTALDESSFQTKITSGNEDIQQSTSLLTFASIAPNTTIKIQYNWQAGVVALKTNRFIMMER